LVDGNKFRGASRPGNSASAFAILLAAPILIAVCSLANAGEPEDEAPVALKLRRVEPITGLATQDTARAAGSLISLEVSERPLRQVLDYLSNVSGKNIRARKQKDERLLVTFKLDNVTWRAILDFIAKKYGMIVDESMTQQNIIFLDTPEKVSMVFNNADIRDVINTIAIQANANIVMGQEVTGPVSMRLENVPWKDALNIVVKTLDFIAVDEANNTIRITTPGRIATQLEIRIFRLAYISPEGARYTALLKSDFVQTEQSTDSESAGKSMIDVLSKVKSDQGKISFEKRTNTIVVQDTLTKLDDMEKIIAKLDIPPKQVHVSVKLVELIDSDVERLGINWANGLSFRVSPVSSWSSAFPFDVSNGLSRSLLGDLAVSQGQRASTDFRGAPIAGGLTDIFTLRRAVGSGGASVDATPSPIALGSMGFGATEALLELVKNKTSGRVIQAPQIITLDNEEATIQVGQLLRYAEEVVSNTEGGGNVGGFREAAGSPLKLGFQLLVIAHVTGPENNILMTIIPKTEDLDRFEDFGQGLRLPQTSQSIVVTKMMLRNGETGVIGGFRRETEQLAMNKVPVFGEIPILGRLFKHRSKSSSARNLLVFVTPTIIDFLEKDSFKRDLDKLRRDLQTPYTIIGEDDNVDVTTRQ